jgi:hypothetical protein
MERRALLELASSLIAVAAAGCTGSEYFFTISNGTGVYVEAGLNMCPRITQVTTAPLEVGVGGYGVLHAEASDVDTDKVAFEWSATEGASITKPSAADTTYVCAAVGVKTLTLTVSDTHGCTDSYRVDVTCAKQQ